MQDGKLFYSPIGKNPQKIIDVGTGTGIWAIEAADQYPGAEVVGIDISPHQPTWIPPNLKFYVDDVEDEWVNGSGFDLVHFRSMALVLRDVHKAITQSFENLKPGGWIEFQETYGMPQCDDETMKDDDIIKRYYETCQLAMKSFGYDIDKPLHLQGYLEKVGFTNVQCIIKKLPLGTWPKDKTLRLVGHYTYLALIDSLPALLAKPFANLGMSEEERQVWGAKVRQAAKETDVHRYYNYYFWFAQKPE
ncbi:putative methyltransferase domain-containing protein [Phaeoacremonium minimum UCRPA7]|uniref:Putative methyltransferase domain-containing protein n=1 Tax=Phaeoacremonium minimum (strain UCR-PA7) TaxID=1286976 RepID=R8BX14_PHAM7|nr:putative methyltransferase domain-containing protein [Phaeoacremonium minimum UCRPA7]EOO03882.1 putative methyltransferase domain-containing protein [Phaeoacremonium minimum UCRPA7]